MSARVAPRRRLSKKRAGDLRAYFEALRLRYNRSELLYSDPLSVPHRWPEGVDREIAGLIAAWLASGRASSIVDSATRLLASLSEGGRFTLRESIEVGGVEEIRQRIMGFRYRWIDDRVMASALYALGRETRQHGSPVEAIKHYDRASEETLVPAVTGFAGRLEDIAGLSLQALGGDDRGFRALKWLIADPSRGGTAKRWMMWLRWFVRADEVDPGGYPELGAHRLLIPLDTHIFRISRYLGFTNRKTPGFRAAEEITAVLRRISPEDPLRYDFSMSRIGILGHCPAAVSKRICAPCVLFPICRAAQT